MLTLSNFTKTLLLTASFLLLTACNSKSDSETNTTVAQSPTTETDTNTDGTDENTTTGGTDDNTSTTPTVTPASLILTIDKTSLNKDENTTVKVMATYSDDTGEEVTDKVEWVVTPSDAVKVANATLTALKDVGTTVKAKMDTVTSDAVNLNITWEVNGHRLPPEPDKTKNDSTLLGIDTNNNNVRDDVERWIYDEYKDKHPIHIDIAMQAGRAYKQVLETPERAKEIRGVVNAPYFCGSYYQNYVEFFNEPVLVHERIDTSIKSRYFNTKERNDVYWQYDTLLSGGSYSLPWPSEMKKQCDFDTSKYEE